MDIFNDIFGEAFSDYKNQLDTYWHNYTHGHPEYIVQYNKAKSDAKAAGYKVFRNSDGVHKLIKQ